MKNLLIILIALAFASCDNSADVTPHSPTEKRGGNGNGNTGGGGNTTPYTIIHTTPTDWNVTFDTSACGVFVLNWDAQPNATTYYIDVIERPFQCNGSSVTTNQWYYTYGFGCSMVIGNTYTIGLSYFVKDDVNRVSTYYYSEIATVQTGSFGLWNCN